MSSFICEQCGTANIDSPEGYKESCYHYNHKKAVKLIDKLETQLNVEIYMMFDGSSADGRGSGKYTGYTRDKSKAFKHFMETQNPYSTGHVDVLTNRALIRISDMNVRVILGAGND